MTDTMTQTVAPDGEFGVRRRGSVILAGVLAACGAAALGLLACLSIVVLGWATDPNSSSTSSALLRSAGHLWLLAHGSPLELAGGTVRLAPLGLTVAIGLLLVRAAHRAGRHTQSRGRQEALVAALSTAPPYALLVAVLASAVRTPGVSTHPSRALVCALALSVAASIAGATRRLGWREATRGWPAPATAAAVAGTAALATLLATGALLVAASLVLDVSQVSVLSRSVQGAGAAGFALLLVQVALVPNAAVWGAAYASGAGFAVGAGTSVGPAGVVLGPVPGLPMLAALPVSGPAPAAAALAIAGVLAAGVVAGVMVARCLGPDVPRHAGPSWTAATALGVGLCFGLICYLAGGEGPGRLSVLGPDPLTNGAAVAQWLALTGVPAAWLTGWLQTRHSAPSRVRTAE